MSCSSTNCRTPQLANSPSSRYASGSRITGCPQGESEQGMVRARVVARGARPLVVQRQRESEGRAFPQLTRHPDLPAVQLDDFLRDGEPEPGAFRLLRCLSHLLEL